MSRHLVIALAAVGVIAACASDYASPPVAASDAGPPPDGGSTPAGGEDPSEVAEAGAADAATGPDAAAPFCADAGGALFCADFEGDASIGALFTRTDTSGGAPSIVAGGREGQALEAKMTKRATSPTASTVAWRTVATSFPVGTSITLRFAFDIRSAGTDYAEIGAIQFGGVEHGLALYDASKCGALAVDCLDENDQEPGHGHSPTGAVALTPGTWHVGTVSLTRSAAGYSGRVTVDGTVVDDRATGAMPSNADTANVEVGVGSFFSSSGQGVDDVLIDDVVVTH